MIARNVQRALTAAARKVSMQASGPGNDSHGRSGSADCYDRTKSKGNIHQKKNRLLPLKLPPKKMTITLATAPTAVQEITTEDAQNARNPHFHLSRGARKLVKCQNQILFLLFFLQAPDRQAPLKPGLKSRSRLGCESWKSRPRPHPT